MDKGYTEYLQVLRQLSQTLEQLSALDREKATVVRQDDLKGLDHILKQEQALSLSLRSLEHKRLTVSGELHLEKLPLSGLAAQYPKELRMEARDTIETLQREYKLYQCSAEVARNTLECNLHEIEKVLEGMENEAPTARDLTASIELPAQLRTDIRA